MTAFARALAFVLKWEGGLGEHANDPGGITNFGISLRFLKSLDPAATPAQIRALSEADAGALYHRHFWLALGAEGLSPAIATALFDTGVNMGPRPAIKFLQRALKVADDGKLGPRTLAAARSADPKAVLAAFFAERNWRYAQLSGFPTFGKGWLTRSAHCHDLTLSILEEEHG